MTGPEKGRSTEGGNAGEVGGTGGRNGSGTSAPARARDSDAFGENNSSKRSLKGRRGDEW